MPRRPRARQSRPGTASGSSGAGTGAGRGDNTSRSRTSWGGPDAYADSDSDSDRDADTGVGAWLGAGARVGGASFVEDSTGSGMAEMRRIQPYQAKKTYICPGCNQEIRPGTGHVVIVPLSDPSARRHWHSPCWEHRGRRRPTGR